MRPATLTQVGPGVSVPMPMDYNINPTDISFSTVVTPPVNYTIQYTFDDVFAAGYNPTNGNWYNSKDPVFLNATSSAYSKVDQPITAARINNAGGGGTIVLTGRQGVKG